MLDFVGKICYIEGMENRVKAIVAKNLTELRKSRGLTQSELAEKLKYSDKTVSKWETGDSLPDISVLAELATLYGISLDDLVHENAAEKIADKAEEAKVAEGRERVIILCLTVAVVFLIASLVFVYLKLRADINYWQAFLWAFPASCVMLLYFGRRAAGTPWISDRSYKVYKTVILSLLCWTFLLAVYFQFFGYQLWLIFIVGVPVELIIWLGSKLNK